jgi:O-antigen/teichoic acid export membrane protein
MSYFYAPQWPRITLKKLDLFAQVIGWNMVSQVLQSLNWQFEKLLLPRFVDLQTFGHYSVANDITGVPFQAIVQPLFRPFLVAFSHMRTNETLGEAYLKASSAIVLLVAPALLLISILSDVVVEVMLGPSWVNTAFLLRYLPLIAILTLPMVPMPSLAMTMNRMHFITIKNLSDLSTKAVLVVGLGYLAGIQGVLVAQAIAATISLVVSMIIVDRLVGLSFIRQCKDLARHVLPIVLMSLFIIPEIYIRKYDLGFVQFTALSCLMAALSIIAYLAGMFLTFKMSNATRSVEYDLVVRLFRQKFRPAV